jgi:hypothetical protein
MAVKRAKRGRKCAFVGVPGLTLGAALAVTGCASPDLDAYNAQRESNLAAIQSMSPSDKIAALRERVLRDGLASNLPANVASIGQGAAFSCNGVLELKCVYMLGPIREQLVEDSDAGNPSDALAAYEDGIVAADTVVLSRVAAARLRATALRGEEKLWVARHEGARAAAARLMASAEDGWLQSAEAKTAQSEYDGLLQQSHSAMGEAVSQAVSQQLAMIQAGLQTAQASLQAAQGAKSGAGASAAVTAMTPVMMAAAKQVVVTVATQLVASAGADLGPLRDLLGTVPGLLDAAKAGTLDAFAATDSGKKALGDVFDAVRALRRGQSMETVKTLVAAASAASSTVAQASGVAQQVIDVKIRLEKLQKLHDDKVISDDEYERERQRILKEGGL